MAMGQAKANTESQTTNTTLLLLTIFNHSCWSTLHVAARYLQVYAKPITFDGQGVLSSAKGFAALFVFLVGNVHSWIEGFRAGRNGHCVDIDNIDIDIDIDSASSALVGSLQLFGNDALSKSASYLHTTKDGANGATLCKDYNAIDNDASTTLQQQQQKPANPNLSQPSQSLMSGRIHDDTNEEPTGIAGVSVSGSVLRKKRVFYILLFAFVSTTRASSNIASSKYTYPYNITLISSLTPIIIAIFDRFLLHSPFPPLLWLTILLSSFGGFLIALSQSIDSESMAHHDDQMIISPRDNLIGCSLQFLSAVFSAIARILMKRTEHILTPTQIVQTNNISNCLFPFIYTTIYNPSSWMAFRYLVFNPKSLLAWCMISIGVYSFASTLQIRLIRRLGPGFYSSWVAIRVLGSMILSTLILEEGIKSWLEWVGVGLMVVTISVYLVETRKWMDLRKEQDQQISANGEDGVDDGDDELVSVSGGEDRPLLAGARTSNIS